MGIKGLRKAVSKRGKDDFPIGTVVRFTSGGMYTYAVVKTAVGWISTARQPNNGFVRQTMTYEQLVKVLSDATNVAVATEWEAL